MAVEYINYIRTEELIRLWPTIQGIKESLAIELGKFINQDSQDEIDDYILSQVIGNKVLTDIPPSGKISDTTGDTATGYNNKLSREYDSSLSNIQEELHCISLVDDKLNIAFRRLSFTQQKILKLFYLEDKTWAETLDELKKEDCFITKQTAQRTRKDGIYKIQRIAKITTDIYLEVMKLVEVE